MATSNIEQELADLQHLYNVIAEFMVNYSFQLVGAIIVFVIGLWVANKVASFLAALMARHQLDITLANFITYLVRVVIIVMVAVIALGKLGISVTPFVAAIGAAALGAGLAVQGLLSNYAAGVTIIITRPFVVNNTITVNGVSGIVKEIRLGMTLLTNADGEEITIPNKHIVGEVLHNTFEYALVETHIGISYQDDAPRAIEVLHRALAQCQQRPLERDEGAHTAPSAQIGIDHFADSSVVIAVRYWVTSKGYYQEKFSTNLALYQAVNQAKITIAFPQREVRVLGSDNSRDVG